MTQLQVSADVSALFDNWAGELVSPSYVDLSSSLENAADNLAEGQLKAACRDMARRWRDGSGHDAIAGLMHRYHSDVFSEEVCMNVAWAAAVGEMQDMLRQISRGVAVLPTNKRDVALQEIEIEEIRLAQIEAGSS
jgi:hypothetical protein